MKFAGVKTTDGWHYVDALGYHVTDDVYLAERNAAFTPCTIDDRQFAVFLDRRLPDFEERARFAFALAQPRPAWLETLLLARLMDDRRIELELASDDDGALLHYAVAAWLALQTHGELGTEAAYTVGVRGKAIRVAMDLDDDTETWFGEAVEVPTQF